MRLSRRIALKVCAGAAADFLLLCVAAPWLVDARDDTLFAASLACLAIAIGQTLFWAASIERDLKPRIPEQVSTSKDGQ